MIAAANNWSTGAGLLQMRSLWPVREAAQADYESLRQSVVSGAPARSDSVARRFDRSGLAGLIAAPHAEAEYVALVVGALRPAWCAHDDPRLEVLREVYGFLLAEPLPHGNGVGVSP